LLTGSILLKERADLFLVIFIEKVRIAPAAGAGCLNAFQAVLKAWGNVLVVIVYASRRGSSQHIPADEVELSTLRIFSFLLFFLSRICRMDC